MNPTYHLVNGYLKHSPVLKHHRSVYSEQIAKCKLSPHKYTIKMLSRMFAKFTKSTAQVARLVKPAQKAPPAEEVAFKPCTKYQDATNAALAAFNQAVVAKAVANLMVQQLHFRVHAALLGVCAACLHLACKATTGRKQVQGRKQVLRVAPSAFLDAVPPRTKAAWRKLVHSQDSVDSVQLMLPGGNAVQLTEDATCSNTSPHELVLLLAELPSPPLVLASKAYWGHVLLDMEETGRHWDLLRSHNGNTTCTQQVAEPTTLWKDVVKEAAPCCKEPPRPPPSRPRRPHPMVVISTTRRLGLSPNTAAPRAVRASRALHWAV